MTESKSVALPLGYIPINILLVFPSRQQEFIRLTLHIAFLMPIYLKGSEVTYHRERYLAFTRPHTMSGVITTPNAEYRTRTCTISATISESWSLNVVDNHSNVLLSECLPLPSILHTCLRPPAPQVSGLL